MAGLYNMKINNRETDKILCGLAVVSISLGAAGLAAVAIPLDLEQEAWIFHFDDCADILDSVLDDLVLSP